jgi:hypothetical protein
MSNVRTSIFIAATPERVWQVLADTAAWPAWNPVIPELRGELRAGATVRFRIHVEKTPALPFSAKVVRCEARRELAWRGGAPLVPALAWGEHYFRLEPSGEGTQFTHGEDFGGLLALAMNGRTHARVVRSYEAMNLALKARAEAP